MSLRNAEQSEQIDLSRLQARVSLLIGANMSIINIIFALLSIGIGAISWLNPKFAMSSLSLGNLDGRTMGQSEVRASAGALFVGMGIGAILLGSPSAYVMLGFCWLGAAVGRLTSILLDGSDRQKITFCVVEAAVGLPAIMLNWST